MFIKMCGMTRPEDVQHAASLGANAIGFIFAPSQRQVKPEHVPQIAATTTGLLKVGVFVNEDLERVRDIREQCNLDIIQLHGDESPDYCEKLGGRLFKVFRLQHASAISRFGDYPPHIHILLDAYVRGVAGGTGKQIEFLLLDKISDFSRIILAGGIGPDNAVELISRYQPYGIDVNSQVESAPGIKDHGKMFRLFENLNSLREIET